MMHLSVDKLVDVGYLSKPSVIGEGYQRGVSTISTLAIKLIEAWELYPAVL